MKVFVAFIIFLSALQGQESYQLESIKPPKNIDLKVTAICKDHSGGLMLATRRGEVWNFRNGQWRLFASGLQQPKALCMSWREGEYFCLQREELTKLVDEDNDGLADLYESFGKGWQGDSQGVPLVADPEGNFYGALPLNHSESVNPVNRGTFFKIDYLGEFAVLATGIAKPQGGLFNEQGDFFLSASKGAYLSSDSVFHVDSGDFLGNPVSLRWDEEQKKNLMRIMRFSGEGRIEELGKLRKAPALYFPFGEDSQIGNMALAANDKFGVKAGQLIVSDLKRSKLWRASLEKVSGVYQGAVYSLYESSSLQARSILLDDKQLYLVQNTQGEESNLVKVTYSGTPDFDIVEIKATSQGFRLVFNQPLEEADWQGQVELSSFRFPYTKTEDFERHDVKEHKILAVKISEDKKSITLSVEALKEGTVVDFNLKSLKSKTKAKLKYPNVYYTLNKIPK